MTHSNSPYLVISRKYRPQLFSDVVGQEPIVTTLTQAVSSKKLAQAYLFCGPRGTGKTTLARLLAKALNCKDLQNSSEPCNCCTSCKEITSGHSLDVLEIDGASNRGIDDSRRINETVAFAPAPGRYKIYIIDEVHMLTKEAFNALLKTLEEPPPNVKFFFATTEPHKVLPTIISRCQRFDLKRIPNSLILFKLKQICEHLQIEVSDEALLLLANRSEGALRDAESLLDQLICALPSPITKQQAAAFLGLLPSELFFSLDQAIAEGRLEFAVELSQKIFQEGIDLSLFLEELLEHFRTLLLFLLGSAMTKQLSLSEEEKNSYTKSATLYKKEQCLYVIDLLIERFQQLGKISFKQIHLEAILFQILRSAKLVTIDSLTNELLDLEKRIFTQTAPSKTLDQAVKSSPQQASVSTHLQSPPPPAAPQHSLQLASSADSPTPLQNEQPSHAKRIAPEPIPIQENLSPPATSRQPQPSAELLSLNKASATVAEGKEPLPLSKKNRYNTILQFAAVELEGSIKHKNS